MKRALVLGGGGLIGMAYHAGALKALDDFGVDVTGAELMIGTSAGSIMTSYMRAGWTPADFVDYARGKHPKVRGNDRQEVRDLFVPMARDRAERIRRGIGSFFAVASSRGYWPGGRFGRIPLPALRRAFPSGMYSTEETQRRLAEDLPEDWPEKDLYICAASLYRKERVTFGHPSAPRAPLPDAVLASTAIPGFFPPVRIGGEQYVDGGVVSATSLDLAVDARADAILCVAPLGFRTDDDDAGLPHPRMWSPLFVRSLFARVLRREVSTAREQGIPVLVLRPWTSDLIEHGTNSMRYFDRQALVESSRTGTLRFLESRTDDPVLKAFTRSDSKNERVG